MSSPATTSLKRWNVLVENKTRCIKWIRLYWR